METPTSAQTNGTLEAPLLVVQNSQSPCSNQPHIAANQQAALLAATLAAANGNLASLFNPATISGSVSLGLDTNNAALNAVSLQSIFSCKGDSNH